MLAHGLYIFSLPLTGWIWVVVVVVVVAVESLTFSRSVSKLHRRTLQRVCVCLLFALRLLRFRVMRFFHLFRRRLM